MGNSEGGTMTTKSEPNLTRFDEKLAAFLADDIQEQVKENYRSEILSGKSVERAGRATERYFKANGICGLKRDGSFEGTFDTEEGLKYLSGVSAEDVPNEAAATCQSLENQIRRSYDALPVADALRTIGAVWTMAENVCELAAARSRLLLGKMPRPELTGAAEWFSNGCDQIDADERESLNPASLHAATTIARCVGKSVPALKADVSVGMLGRIVFDWHTASRFSWMIDATDLPFPLVRIYEARQLSSGEMSSRIIHNMFEAIRSLEEMAS